MTQRDGTRRQRSKNTEGKKEEGAAHQWRQRGVSADAARKALQTAPSSSELAADSSTADTDGHGLPRLRRRRPVAAVAAAVVVVGGGAGSGASGGEEERPVRGRGLEQDPPGLGRGPPSPEGIFFTT